MIRAPRRHLKHERREITAKAAFEYESNRSWPAGERLRFWNDPRVPARLRETAEPDPRRVLEGNDARFQFVCDLIEWKHDRLDWLREQMKNG